MQAEMKEKLVIIAPQGVPIYLKEQSDLIDLGIDQIQFIPNYNIESKKTLYGSYEA